MASGIGIKPVTTIPFPDLNTYPSETKSEWTGQKVKHSCLLTYTSGRQKTRTNPDVTAMAQLSVIIPTHNPNHERLHRTLSGLRAQTLPAASWKTILVNNASTDFPTPDFFRLCAPDNFVIVEEPKLGLTAARICGFRFADTGTGVLVDDDMVQEDFRGRVPSWVIASQASLAA